MFVAVFCVLLLCQINAEPVKVRYRCNDTNSNVIESMTFTPSLDGVTGRYTAELCRKKGPWTYWTLDLTCEENMDLCRPGFVRSKFRAYKPGPQHSTITLDINDLSNCTYVCYAMDFDMIFSSCYKLQSTLKNDGRSSRPYDTYHLVNNNVTKDDFFKNEPHVQIINHDDGLLLKWNLGIPPVEYTVTLTTNETGGGPAEDVTRNCTLREARVLDCWLAPPYGCYDAMVTNGGPWVSGLFFSFKFITWKNLCRVAVRPPPVAGRDFTLALACGGAALAAVALVLARKLYRAVLLPKVKSWIEIYIRQGQTQPAPAAEPERDSRAVLLLYAREGEFGQSAVDALKDLIEDTTKGMVYDIHSAEVLALCASAPLTWLHGMLRRGDVRVLLLQSPAAAALYRAQLAPHDAGLKLSEPLLGRGALYREPQFTDTLLQAALRYIAETPEIHDAYHQFYLATYSALDTDILQQVEPYRRYRLPGAAAALAAELARAPPLPAALQRLERAAQRWALHAQQHPDYLDAELVRA